MQTYIEAPMCIYIYIYIDNYTCIIYVCKFEGVGPFFKVLFGVQVRLYRVVMIEARYSVRLYYTECRGSPWDIASVSYGSSAVPSVCDTISIRQ